MIDLLRQTNLEDRELKLAQEARREYRSMYPKQPGEEEAYVNKRVAELIQREGGEEDVSISTGWRGIMGLFKMKQKSLENSRQLVSDSKISPVNSQEQYGGLGNLCLRAESKACILAQDPEKYNKLCATPDWIYCNKLDDIIPKSQFGNPFSIFLEDD